MKYAKSRDGNEKPIFDALVAAGASVTRLNDDGVPDLLVGFNGQTFLIEVKLPLTKRGAKSQRREAEGGSGDFTKAQVKWWGGWKGTRALVVRSPEDALAAIGAT